MRDLQRDCKPFWKFSELERELLDIAALVKKLGADHRREVTARRNLKQEILKIKEKVDAEIAVMQEDLDSQPVGRHDG